MRWQHLAATLLVLALVAAPVRARANGRFPLADQLLARPGHPDHLVLRATFGLLVSADRGAHWDWICESAIGYSGEEDPGVAYTGGGAIVVAMREGLAVSEADGCAFQRARGPAENRGFVDVTLRPDDARGLVALASTPHNTGDGGVMHRTQLLASSDDGASWTAMGAPLDPWVLVTTLEVTRKDRSRVYVAGVRPTDRGPRGVMLVSKDAGRTWAEHAVALDPTREAQLFVSGVDPLDPDRVYLRSRGPGVARLLVSDDGGATSRAVLSGTRLSGFALSPDGAQIFVGDSSGGLLVATRKELTFTKRSPLPVNCLLAAGPDLYACSFNQSAFVVGLSRDQGHRFDPLLWFGTLRGPLACLPRDGGAGVCDHTWPTTMARLARLATAQPDAAALLPPTASTPEPPPTREPPARACGCHAGAPPGDMSLVGALLAASFAIGRRAGSRTRARGAANAVASART